MRKHSRLVLTSPEFWNYLGKVKRRAVNGERNSKRKGMTPVASAIR
jgi:hypothetical protein